MLFQATFISPECDGHYRRSKKGAFASEVSVLQINFWPPRLSCLISSSSSRSPSSWSCLITEQIQCSALAVTCRCYFPSGRIPWPWPRCILPLIPLIAVLISMIVAICYTYRQHQQLKKKKIWRKRNPTNEITLNGSSPNYLSYLLQLTDWK